MIFYVLLWPNERFVSVVHGPAPCYKESISIQDAMIYTALGEARKVADEQGWNIGILECKLVGKVQK